MKELFLDWFAKNYSEQVDDEDVKIYGNYEIVVNGKTFQVLPDDVADAALFYLITDDLESLDDEILTKVFEKDADTLRQDVRFRTRPITGKLRERLLTIVKEDIGRGAFLSSYDGEEISLGDGIFTYRID